MDDLEGSIYEPWVPWKSESESKSKGEPVNLIPKDYETERRDVLSMGHFIVLIAPHSTGKSYILNHLQNSVENVGLKVNQNSELSPPSIFQSLHSQLVDPSEIEMIHDTVGNHKLNVSNEMKKVDSQQLIETFHSITKKTFYQYMIPILLCYQVLECLAMTRIQAMVTQALGDSTMKSLIRSIRLITQFSPLHLWLSQATQQSGSVIHPQLVDRDMKQGGKHAGHDEEIDHEIFTMGDFKSNNWILLPANQPSEKYSAYRGFQSLRGNEARPSSCRFDRRSFMTRNDTMVNRVQEI